MKLPILSLTLVIIFHLSLIKKVMALWNISKCGPGSWGLGLPRRVETNTRMLKIKSIHSFKQIWARTINMFCIFDFLYILNLSSINCLTLKSTTHFWIKRVFKAPIFIRSNLAWNFSSLSKRPAQGRLRTSKFGSWSSRQRGNGVQGFADT